MAVFTKLDKNEIEEYVSSYNIGELQNYNEIIDGIENTNYKIICGEAPYILTIFEKRVKEEDLPFFMDLKLYLNHNNFKCPQPIKNKKGEIINKIKGKKAAIISFIEGEKIKIPTKNECNEIGKIIANLHNLTVNFNQKRDNSLDILEWKKLFNKCENNHEKIFENLIIDLKNEINYLEKLWPKDLPSGIIHADLFKDNVFFYKEKITGVIDFYFSCFHFFLYDISIVINDWCFTDNGKQFEYDFLNAILNGYTSLRKLTEDELNAFNLMLRAAAVRILVTRLHDYIYHPQDAMVIKKDPFQYYNILKWHQKNLNLNI